MEFDKTKVYTALNADELKAGDKVFVADDIARLRDEVEIGKNVEVIKEVLVESQPCRFRTNAGVLSNAFAYLVERAPDSQKDNFRPFKDTKKLIEWWFCKIGYRAKDLTMPIIWLKNKKHGYVSNIISYFDDFVEIETGTTKFDMKELFDNFTFLDGTPCGIQTFYPAK